ncbi:MAG: hypothetical protein ACI350_07895 [Prevotella sp.]
MKKKCLFLLCLTVCASCDDSQKQLRAAMETLQSTPLTIDLSEMERICYDDSVTEHYMTLPAYRLVVYTDSTECASCAVRKIGQWKPLMDTFSVYTDCFDFLFVFTPKHADIERVRRQLQHERFGHDVYLDTCNGFARANPQIPSTTMMHAFLVNARDSVVMVGNPLHNKKVHNLLVRLLDEKCR